MFISVPFSVDRVHLGIPIKINNIHLFCVSSADCANSTIIKIIKFIVFIDERKPFYAFATGCPAQFIPLASIASGPFGSFGENRFEVSVNVFLLFFCFNFVAQRNPPWDERTGQIHQRIDIHPYLRATNTCFPESAVAVVAVVINAFI